MRLGWISLWNGVFVLLLLVPNIVYARKHPHTGGMSRRAALNILEQVGRYASMAFMVLPFPAVKFGYANGFALAAHLFGATALLIGYWCVWARYAHERTRRSALALAILPCTVFLLTGIALWHPPLIASALLFGAGHIPVTLETHT